MSDIAVKLENISKFYKLYNDPKDRLKEALNPFGRKYHRKFYALTDINLEIKKGEILGIVGRNGAGKSTLLKIISGVIQPNEGNIVLNGAISALLELGAGFNPDFTGMQNLYFSGTMMGFSREEMDKRINDITSFADIGDFIHQPLKTYSSGMQARLGFALAINIDPVILIVDEVLSVGDELFSRKCYAKMEEIFKAGCTVLFVSHDANTINEICSRAILLDNGEQILEGSPKLVTMHYQKLLYAKPGKQKEIRNEIIRLNKNEYKKKKSLKNVEKIKKKDNTETETRESQQEAFYIPNFKPKSTMEYKNYDVVIHDAHIRKVDGKQVNALVVGEKYIFSYKVKFNIDAEKVIFGMKLKTVKGLEIEGTAEPGIPGKGKYIEKVCRGDQFNIDWQFDCVFIPGYYYINAGVYGTIDGFEGYLNRLVDCIVFKVQNVPERNYGGLVHVCKNTTITKLDK